MIVLNVHFINFNLKQVSNILKARDLKCLAFSFFLVCSNTFNNTFTICSNTFNNVPM